MSKLESATRALGHNTGLPEAVESVRKLGYSGYLLPQSRSKLAIGQVFESRGSSLRCNSRPVARLRKTLVFANAGAYRLLSWSCC